MSHTNSTTNYGLPEFLSSDKPAWMGDMNPAFSDIDTQMKLNADAAAQANTDIGTVGLNFAAGYSNVSTYDVGDVVTYNKRMYVCDVAVTVPEAFDNSKWSYYKCSDIAHTAKEAEASASAVAGDVSDINDAIGNTDISAIGDGTLTGAISSVNANLSELERVHIGSAITLSGSPYTCTSDGYFTVVCSSAGGYVYGYIDSTVVVSASMISPSAQSNSTVFVRKGMTINIVGSGTYSGTFIPITA